MTTIRATLTDPRANGLYRLPASLSPADLAARVGEADVRFARIAGDEITDKAALLRALAVALHFPPYFGRNWDALTDCLTDLTWLPEGGLILLFDHPAPLIRRSPATWATAVEIFVEAAVYWRGKGRPFSVFVRRTGGLLPTVPIVDR